MINRIQRVNQLIKKELALVLLREVDFPEKTLVTLTRVETSVDLQQAKIYISAIPENQILRVFQVLNSQIYRLQQSLNKRLKMKQIPRIKFAEEKETRQAGRIEEILEELKK